MKKVFVAGEGPNELGDWARHPAYQRAVDRAGDDARGVERPGVVEALLRRVRPDGWTVIGGRAWKTIRKLQVRPPVPAEVRNVRGLALDAWERGADVLAFVRDRDGDREREQHVEAGIEAAAGERPGLAIAGGMAIERLESWMVALHGERRSEEMSVPERFLRERGVGDKSTGDFVRAVEEAQLDRIPHDATSLRRWIARAEGALGGEAGSAIPGGADPR